LLLIVFGLIGSIGASATNFNTAIEIILDSIVASFKGCKERVLYEAEQAARGSVRIEF